MDDNKLKQVYSIARERYVNEDELYPLEFVYDNKKLINKTNEIKRDYKVWYILS